MAVEDKFTDSIINSALEELKKQDGWDEQLSIKIKELHMASNLTNIQALSSTFEEITASKEDKKSD